MNISDYISGKYIEQYQYKSFSPTLINHAWEITDGELLTLLSDADRAVGELNAYSQLVPDVDFFIRMHITKEATESTRLEGTQTNMQEAFLDVEDIEPEKQDDWMEVQNYIQAINAAIEQLESLPLSNRLLKNTHKTLMQGVRGDAKLPGEFRQSQNWIGVSLKHAVFVPPHCNDLNDLMSDLEQFIHNEQYHVPHLIKIALLHYQFETIHPFLDGNGRLGRLMIALYFANFGLLHKPALYLSDYFERHKTEYIDRLMAVREGNKLHEWLIFFLYGVRETAYNSIQVFKDILSLKEHIELKILPHFSAPRQHNVRRLIQALYKQPLIDIKQTSLLLDIKTNTASALIKDLVKLDLLEEMTGKQRNRLFVFKDYLMIFNREHP